MNIKAASISKEIKQKVTKCLAIQCQPYFVVKNETVKDLGCPENHKNLSHLRTQTKMVL